MWILYAQVLLLAFVSFLSGCGVALIALRARLGAVEPDPDHPPAGDPR
jgi:hypothetical protein